MIYSCNSTYSYLSFYDDQVLKNQHYTLTQDIQHLDFRSNLKKVRKIFSKVINEKKEINYRMYDELTFNNEGFNISDSFYMVIDDINIFKFNISKLETTQKRNITENKKQILTADSKKIDVVTGYNNEDLKILKFSYPIDNKIVEQMKTAKKIYFQYYSGPSIIKLDIPRIS